LNNKHPPSGGISLKGNLKMKPGFDVFYVDGNKFYVVFREHGYVEICQQRYLSGNAYDETGNHGKSWFRNVSKVNRDKAVKMYKLLSVAI
jgi:hypothetical protein